MKNILRSTLFALGLLFVSSPAFAVICGGGAGGTCFWILAGGAANWNATTNWSLTSGGVSCVCTPAGGEAIIFDSNSGTNGSTINANISIASLDTSGTGGSGSPFTGTITHNSSIIVTITGDLFRWGTGTIYAAGSTNRGFTFTPLDTHTVLLTSNGVSFSNATVLVAATDTNKTGVVQLQDNYSQGTGGSLTVTTGGFDANGKNLTLPNFSSTGSGVRAVTMGSSNTWTMQGTTGGTWDFTTTTNMTYTQGTANIVLNDTTATPFTFIGGGKTFNNLTINSKTAPGYVQFKGSPTFANMSVTAPIGIQVFGSTTLTISNAPTWTGSSGNYVVLHTNATTGSVSGNATLAITTGTMQLHWAAIDSLTLNGAASADNSFNLGGNNTGSGTGWNITAPIVGGGGHCIGC